MKPLRIIIFAKAPLAGFAKTRLIPELGAAGAAALAQRLIQYAVEQALATELGIVELCITPNGKDELWANLGLPKNIVFSVQGEGDLGARMARAAKRTIEHGEAALLIGTDCPQLDSDQLRLAARGLQSADACLVPVADGGYSLLGLNQFSETLFNDMPWSTECVAQLTRECINSLGWQLNELPMLNDIDRPEDLQWLPSALQQTEYKLLRDAKELTHA